MGTRKRRTQKARIAALRMRVKTKYAAAQRGLGQPRACADPSPTCVPATEVSFFNSLRSPGARAPSIH
jgi:hypothetical protein